MGSFVFTSNHLLDPVAFGSMAYNQHADALIIYGGKWIKNSLPEPSGIVRNHSGSFVTGNVWVVPLNDFLPYN